MTSVLVAETYAKKCTSTLRGAHSTSRNLRGLSRNELILHANLNPSRSLKTNLHNLAQNKSFRAYTHAGETRTGLPRSCYTIVPLNEVDRIWVYEALTIIHPKPYSSYLPRTIISHIRCLWPPEQFYQRTLVKDSGPLFSGKQPPQ